MGKGMLTLAFTSRPAPPSREGAPLLAKVTRVIDIAVDRLPDFARCRTSSRRIPPGVPSPLTILVLLASMAGGVGAADTARDDERQPPESITAAGADFLRTLHDDDPSLTIGGGRLDERLRLSPCAGPLESRLAPGSRPYGRVTVRVSCSEGAPWRVHVQFELSRERTLWTLARSARRGEVLTRDMLEKSTVTLGRGETLAARSGVPIDAPDAWLGHEFVRDASGGGLLLENMLAPRRLIERGAAVRLRVAGDGLAIETAGVALADAALHERVSVRNDSSGRTVEGIAIARGVVEVVRARRDARGNTSVPVR